MINKNDMKKAIINDFNKKKNYDYILKKIGENKMKKFNKIVIPSGLVTLIMICGIIVFSHKELKNDNEKIPTYENKILINQLDNLDNQNASIAGGIYDIAGGFYEEAIEELEVLFPKYLLRYLEIIQKTKELENIVLIVMRLVIKVIM